MISNFVVRSTYPVVRLTDVAAPFPQRATVRDATEGPYVRAKHC